MTRKFPNLSTTVVAALAAAGLWSCGVPAPAVVGYPGVDDTAVNLTQLASPCTYVADGGVMTVAMAPDEYALIGQTTNAALIGPPNTNPLTVNGTACGAATVASTKRINVNGNTGNETVIVDYLNGPFALGTAASPGIVIDLKAGATDAVKIRGGGYDDVVWVATADAGTASLAGQYAVSVGVGTSLATGAPAVGVKGMVFSNVESLVVSTGPGADLVLTNGKADAGFPSLPFGLANLAGSAPSLTIYGGEGNDTVDFGKAKGGAVFFYGGTEANASTGTDVADFSLRTNALTLALGGAAAGEASEAVTLGSDVEVLSGGAGADTLSCAAALACTLNGNAGNDTLTGSSAADTLNGGAGDDLLVPGAGSDTCTGGAGTDTISYADGVGTRAANGTTVTLPLLGAAASTGNGDQVLSESDSIADDVENVIGSAGVDHIQGNDADNVIYGGAGADILKGGAGNDTFLMGVSLAADGKDNIDGEAGEDTVDFSNGGSTLVPADWTKGWTVPLFITLNGAVASTTCGTAAANATFCVVTNIENVIGSAGVDTITGDVNDNRLEGGNAGNTIVGGGGNDVIAPGSGINSVTCGAAGNSILLPGGTTTNVGGVCH